MWTEWFNIETPAAYKKRKGMNLVHTGKKVTTFKERFSELVASSERTDTEISRGLKVSKQTISAWKIGTRSPKEPTIIMIAQYFRVSVEWLMGFDVEKEERYSPDLFNGLPANIIPLHTINRHKIPVLGSVAAGEPIYDEEIDVLVDGPLKADCALIVKGSSMEPVYLEGDLLYIYAQSDIDYDGQIAVVVFEEEACVKHVYRQSEGLLLVSDNPAFAPMLKRYTDFDNNIRIIGKVIGYTRMYKE